VLRTSFYISRKPLLWLGTSEVLRQDDADNGFAEPDSKTVGQSRKEMQKVLLLLQSSFACSSLPLRFGKALGLSCCDAIPMLSMRRTNDDSDDQWRSRVRRMAQSNAQVKDPSTRFRLDSTPWPKSETQMQLACALKTYIPDFHLLISASPPGNTFQIKPSVSWMGSWASNSQNPPEAFR